MVSERHPCGREGPAGQDAVLRRGGPQTAKQSRSGRLESALAS